MVACKPIATSRVGFVTRLKAKRRRGELGERRRAPDGGLVVGGRSSPQDLPGVRTHKLINLVLMEDLNTQSPRLPPEPTSRRPIFRLNDADATGISEGPSGPCKFFIFFLFSPFFTFHFYLLKAKHIFEVTRRLLANSSHLWLLCLLL